MRCPPPGDPDEQGEWWRGARASPGRDNPPRFDPLNFTRTDMSTDIDTPCALAPAHITHMRLLPSLRPARANDLAQRCPCVQPRQLAASPKNPLVRPA